MKPLSLGPTRFEQHEKKKIAASFKVSNGRPQEVVLLLCHQLPNHNCIHIILIQNNAMLFQPVRRPSGFTHSAMRYPPWSPDITINT